MFEESYLLVRDVVWSGRNLPAFRKNLLHRVFHWRPQTQIPPKR